MDIIVIVAWGCALLYSAYTRENILHQLIIRYLGNNTWDIRCSNIFLAAAIVLTIVDMALYLMVALISLGGSLSFIW